MSQINPVSGNAPIAPIQSRPAAKPAGAAEPAPPRPADRLELSGASHLLKLAKANDVRLDKVQDIKAQLANGTYETPEKFDAAADRLLEDLMG